MKRVQDVVSGFVIALCLHSLFQDMLGLEDYVAHCRDHWVDASWSVPFAVGALLAEVWYLARK